MSFKLTITALIILFCIILINSYAQKFSDNQIKATFISRISEFIKWNKGGIGFCSINEEQDDNQNSISDTLSKLVESRSLPIIVRKNIRQADIGGCDILFIGKKATIFLKDIIASLPDKVVTISDINGFTRKGGMFGFIYGKNNNIKLELNHKKAKAKKIEIRATLLEMIRIVE